MRCWLIAIAVMSMEESICHQEVGTYSKIPRLLKRIGIKNGDKRIFTQMKNDDEFVKYVKTKFNNADCRILNLGEKKEEKKGKIKVK